MIEFVVEGDPVPKGRARVVFDERGGKFRGVTPARTREYETRVGWALRSAYVGAPLTGPLVLTLRVFERPRLPQHEADLDNYVKAVGDALNGLAWVDDRQVVRLDAEIERGAEAPRIVVSVAPRATE